MMQSSPTNLTEWGQVLTELARTLGSGGIGSLVTWLLMRRKTAAEVHATDAVAAKSFAEAQREYADIISGAYNRIDKLDETCQKQQATIRQMVMDQDKRIMREEFLEFEVEWLNAVLKAASVKLSDYDYLRRKRDDSNPV